jgi:two-component system response regulator RegX3
LARVLVVEDEESFSDALSYMLRKEGFEVSVAATGTSALTQFDRTGADIVLLDLMLPEMSGTEVCRQLRQRSAVPIIMVTARDSEIDKVVGLEIGADDYVTKPYSPRELVARIRAVLRRQGTEAAEVTTPTLAAGPVRMDVERHVVTVDGSGVQLPLKEFELLELLLRNAGRVLTRGQLIDRVWAPTTSVTPRPWTCTSSGCAPRWSRSRRHRVTSSPCEDSATNSSRDLSLPDDIMS